MEGKKDREAIVNENQDDEKQETIFKTREVVVEEMAIDGICGVY